MKSHVDNFNVPRGAYDSAQVPDLTGIYILDTLGRIFNLEQVGLLPGWRNYLHPDSNSPKTSKIQKKIIRAFKLLGLQIEIASNLKIVDFLDVTLNLDNDTFKHFSKSNSTPTNINIDSIHPRSILKQIPNAMNQRRNRLSSCKKELWRAKGYTMKPSKTADSTVDWSMWTQWTPALMEVVVVVVGPPNSSR